MLGKERLKGPFGGLSIGHLAYHTARTSFYLDGGPHPELAHGVTPGVDYDFIPIRTTLWLE